MSAFTHKLPAEWHSRAVHVNVAGCGGNGCHVLMGLAQLQKALRGLGHPGLEVTAFDPDTVSEANLGRQLFTEEDIGQISISTEAAEDISFPAMAARNSGTRGEAGVCFSSRSTSSAARTRWK